LAPSNAEVDLLILKDAALLVIQENAVKCELNIGCGKMRQNRQKRTPFCCETHQDCSNDQIARKGRNRPYRLFFL